MTTSGISSETISCFRDAFINNDKDRLAQLVACRSNLNEITLTRDSVINNPQVFNIRLDTEAKPVCNQKNSGRCWIFACMNVMRLRLMKQLRIEEFELSQNYLFFWDKIERSYFSLHTYLECARAGEKRDGRLVQHLLREPVMDAGQWDMLVNLIEKYGVMPKVCWNEPWSCENSDTMNFILQTKMREYCHIIYGLVEAGKSDEEIRTTHMKEMMSDVYRVVSICLGTPPHEFTFEYYEKDSSDSTGVDPPKKIYQKIGPITPLDFYQKYVKPSFNMENQVCLVHDPRPNNPFRAVYSVDKLNNMVNARQVRYLNLPIEKMKEYCLKTLLRNEAVWFGCHDDRQYSNSKGLHTLDVYNYEALLDVRPFALSKANRLIYGDSLMTHAMALVGVNVDKVEGSNGQTEEETKGTHGKFQRWRVENSWGPESGHAGYICMNDEWYDEYVFEVVIDRNLLDKELQRIYDGPVTMLPAWDPMGALAK